MKLRPGRIEVQKSSMFWVVYSDRTPRAAHTYKGWTSQRLARFGPSGLWSWTFLAKNVTFINDYNNNFITSRGDGGTFIGLKVRPQDHLHDFAFIGQSTFLNKIAKSKDHWFQILLLVERPDLYILQLVE